MNQPTPLLEGRYRWSPVSRRRTTRIWRILRVALYRSGCQTTESVAGHLPSWGIRPSQWHASIRYVRNHYPKNQKKRLCMREISVADGRGTYRRCHSLAMRPFSGSLDGTCSFLRDCWSHRNVDAWISGLCRRDPRRLFHVYTIWRERHKMQRHLCRHIHQPVWPSDHMSCDCGDVNFTRR